MANQHRVKTKGQVNLLSGDIEGIEELVNKPKVLEYDGLKVIRLIIPHGEIDTPKYTETALAIARKMMPDIKSKSKPVWLQKNWQANRRKNKAGVL